jgi:hypothetical protein
MSVRLEVVIPDAHRYLGDVAHPPINPWTHETSLCGLRGRRRVSEFASMMQPTPRWSSFVAHFAQAILAVVAIAPVGGVAGEVQQDSVRWRCPQRDGVNCLYLQLRMMGYNGNYEQLVTAMPGGVEQANLHELAQAAQRLGFPLVPVKASAAELAKAPLPVLVLCEGLGRDSGRFHLLLGFSPSKVHLVDGAFITRYELISIDRFRREWTGFALIPQPRSRWPGRYLGAALGSVVALVLYTLATRVARWRMWARPAAPRRESTSPEVQPELQ